MYELDWTKNTNGRGWIVMSQNYRDGGKGDKPRPLPNKEQFDQNWESIFKKKTNIPQPDMKEKK